MYEEKINVCFGIMRNGIYTGAASVSSPANRKRNSAVDAGMWNLRENDIKYGESRD